MYKVKNLRDKVYAFQGISDDPGALTTVYNCNVSLVYMDTALYFLGKEVLVNLLQYAGIGWGSLHNETPNLPDRTPSLPYKTSLIIPS